MFRDTQVFEKIQIMMDAAATGAQFDRAVTGPATTLSGWCFVEVPTTVGNEFLAERRCV